MIFGLFARIMAAGEVKLSGKIWLDDRTLTKKLIVKPQQLQLADLAMSKFFFQVVVADRNGLCQRRAGLFQSFQYRFHGTVDIVPQPNSGLESSQTVTKASIEVKPPMLQRRQLVVDGLPRGLVSGLLQRRSGLLHRFVQRGQR